MSITDLENDLKIPSPSQSDSNFGHNISTKFIGDEETIQTMNILTKYDIHVLEYIKYCMTKYHHDVFLVICERRANYIKKYHDYQQHINKPKKTHQQSSSSSSYLKNHMRRRKLNALYDNGEDYDESYFNNDNNHNNDNDVSELDYNLSRDADDTANLSEALRVISKGIDKISVLIKEKEKEKQDMEYQKLIQNIINITMSLLLFVFMIFVLFVIVIISTFSRESIQSI
jgi:hypothetical protein